MRGIRVVDKTSCAVIVTTTVAVLSCSVVVAFEIVLVIVDLSHGNRRDDRRNRVWRDSNVLFVTVRSK